MCCHPIIGGVRTRDRRPSAVISSLAGVRTQDRRTTSEGWLAVAIEVKGLSVTSFTLIGARVTRWFFLLHLCFQPFCLSVCCCSSCVYNCCPWASVVVYLFPSYCSRSAATIIILIVANLILPAF